MLRNTLMLCSPRRIQRTAKNLLLWRRMRRKPDALRVWNAHFSPNEYLFQYPEIARAGVDPELHYLVFGNDEARDPSERFNTRSYLDWYPDVRESGLNALLHFALHGKAENREPGLCTDDFPVNAIPIDNQPHTGGPLVSVVIPCFNYGRFLESAIRSVLNQTLQDFEIVVVEGGSTDPASVAETRRLESLGLPKTEFFYRSQPCLVGDNRNYGIERSRGRYICCLDADDQLRPIYLEVAVFMAEVFGYEFVYPSTQSFGEEESLWLVKNTSFEESLQENWVSTVALFRRNSWVQIGGFRDWGKGEEYVPEDWDFWIRLLGHGHAGRAIRAPLLAYRVHGQSLTHSATHSLESQREQLRSANQTLIDEFCPEHVRRYKMRNPLANLPPLRDNRPSVLLALPFLTIGGAERLFQTIGQGIAARGERLLVTTSLALPEVVPDNRDCFQGITPHVYPLRTLFPEERGRREFFLYLLRRYHVRTLLIAGSEFVYHLLPDLLEEFPNLTVIDQLFNDAAHIANNRRYAGFIRATVVPSAALKRTLVDRHRADPSSVRVIPHGIPIPPEGPSDHGVYPPEGRGKVIVGFFGRLSPEKAPDAFLHIVENLAAEQDLYFVMTGAGPERTRVLERIRRRHLQHRIYTPGFVEDVQPLMRAADIVVLPSRIDGMPLAVLESQALGKPVVASTVGSVPEMIAHGETGFLCPVDDIKAFCSRILQLARDRDLRRRMGLQARLRIIERYSAERMIDQYYGIVREAASVAESNIAGHGAPSGIMDTTA